MPRVTNSNSPKSSAVEVIATVIGVRANLISKAHPDKPFGFIKAEMPDGTYVDAITEPNGGFIRGAKCVVSITEDNGVKKYRAY